MDEYGRGTFDWPALHTLKQKPLQAKTVDNDSDRFSWGKWTHASTGVHSRPKGEQRSEKKSVQEIESVEK